MGELCMHKYVYILKIWRKIQYTDNSGYLG